MQLHSALVLVLTTMGAASLLWARQSSGVTPNESARASLLVGRHARECQQAAAGLDVSLEGLQRRPRPEPGRAVPGVQVRPVFADGRLYITTPSSIVIALDGETGEEQWRHDPQAGAATRCYDAHRGVALWPASSNERTGARTIFSGTCDGRLIALDAATGQPAKGFGTRGSIDLRPAPMRGPARRMR